MDTHEPGSPSPTLRVESGAIVALRLFDVAYSIDLAAAESAWAHHSQGASRGHLVEEGKSGGLGFLQNQ